MKKIFYAFAAAALLVSCKKEETNSPVSKGPEAAFFHGKTWSSFEVNSNGEPKQLVLTIDSNVMKNVINHNTGHHHENSVSLALPAKAIELTPFKFIMLDWAPDGHPPAGVYTIAHFDIHFYMSTAAQVATFVDDSKMDVHPGQEYIPANYIGGPVVPQMGKHWIDITGPEFAGQGFTQTFIFGTYNGNVEFYEPMITHDFLKNTASFQRAIPQPAKVKTTGFYPTRMRVSKHDGVTDIILDEFVKRQAS